MNLCNDNGVTPLGGPQGFQHLDLTEILLTYPDINVKRSDKLSQSSLFVVSSGGDTNIVTTLLVQLSIDFNLPTK